ncbi:TetR/AcrR family transcriptional regulator [Kineococcus sp. SYSU DK003]|uniref:TetR/AcrR family transcriptional regulator n=1 Tax=Kineococcus sp. SYSU DK003 TaxID=3383124 RepID=UPI003D7D4D65
MARPRSFDEATVVRAARDTFWTKGYAATSLDDLTAATGLGRGSLYNTFGDKEQLFHRALEDYCAAADEGLRADLTGPGSGRAKVEGWLRASAESVAADEERRGCMLAKSTAELASRDPVVVARAHATLDLFQDLLTDCLEQARREGELLADADPRGLAGMVLAVGRGMEALGKAGASAEELRRIAESTIAALPRP